MRYVDLLLVPNAPKEEPPKPVPSPEAMRYLIELNKSEGWKMFRQMVEALIFDWEQKLINGTGTPEGDAAVRSALHTAVGFLTWPERAANQHLEWMERIKGASVVT